MLVSTLGGTHQHFKPSFKPGSGFEKVYCLYTYENIDIFGWSLNNNNNNINNNY